MQLCTKTALLMAVRMVMMIWMICLMVSFFITIGHLNYKLGVPPISPPKLGGAGVV